MEQDKKTLRKERREQRKQNIGRARRFRTARTWGILALIVAAAGIAGWVWWFRLSAGSAEFSATESCVNHQTRSEEHTSELQSQFHLVCPLLLEKYNLQ